MILYNFKICKNIEKKRTNTIFFQIIPKNKEYCITKFLRFESKKELKNFLKRLKSNKKYKFDKIITWLDYD